MFELELTEGTTIILEPGQQLTFRPRLLINSLKAILTSRNNARDIDSESMNLIGSKEDWLHMSNTDTFAFDADTHLLTLISFYFSEENKVPDSLFLVKAANKIVGLPKLAKYPEHFELEPFPYRYYHLEGDILLCFNDEFELAQQLTEVSLSKDFSLFFSDNHYCGWGLYHPETFVVIRVADEIEYASNPILKESFQDVFDLIAAEPLDRISIERDEYSLQKMANLHNKILNYGAAPSSPLASLAFWLFDVAGRYYEDEKINSLFVK